MQPTSQPQHPWDQFKDLKDEAYLYIDQGLRLEQTSKPDRVSSDGRLTTLRMSYVDSQLTLSLLLQWHGLHNRNLCRFKITCTYSSVLFK